MHDVAVLILAAGRARRFGRDKRAVRLDGGERLVDRAVAQVRAAGLAPFLVLREADDLEPPAAVPVLRAARAEEGMGGSLADAVRLVAAVAPPAGWRGCLVMLADMPWLQPASIRAVAQALHPDTIVLPRHDGRAGHPVGFGRHFFEALQTLGGDRGARALLRQHAGAVRDLPLDDAGILRDVDTITDLLTPPPS